MEDSGVSTDLPNMQADPGGPPDEAPSTDHSSGEPQQAPSAAEAVALKGSELDPQNRSHSMDSAYGTLSPESLLELQSRAAASEEESTEEDREAEAEGEVEEEEAEHAQTEDVEAEEEQEEGDEGEEDDGSSDGSRLSVAHRIKPRRRPPVHHRLQSLQKLGFKCRSEDNLLQLIQDESNHSMTQAAMVGSDCHFALGLPSLNHWVLLLTVHFYFVFVFGTL